jgi:GTP-binding protein
VGRPNVGKSTLFNSLTGRRDALVAPVPGVTRDRRESTVARDGLRFTLVDTGGMPFDKLAAFGTEIEGQIVSAVSAAAIVWVIVDAAEGLNPYDEELARRVRISGRPWLVIANKAEGPERLGRLGDFYRLGAPQVLAVSALQRQGLAAVLEASVKAVPALRPAPMVSARAESVAATAGEPGATAAPSFSGETARSAETALSGEPAQAGFVAPIRVAFVGRPNVGKSSLVNAILGEPRFIVSDIPGTTREAVDVLVVVEGEGYALVDTAGLRRKARTTEYLDKLSAVNTLQALDHAEVAVLVLDASQGAVDQDAHIAGHILERNRACVVALNKWDLVQQGGKPGTDVQGDIEHALRFLSLAEPVRVSAVTGNGLRHLFRSIRTAYRQFTRTIPTADLNRALQMIARHTPPPARGRAPTRVFYGTQTGARPPAFKIFTNHPEQVRSEYTRFMERQLRYHFGFEGTPLRIEWSGRDRGEPDAARGPSPAARAGGNGRAAPSRRRRPARQAEASGRASSGRPGPRPAGAGAKAQPGAARQGRRPARSAAKGRPKGKAAPAQRRASRAGR